MVLLLNVGQEAHKPRALYGTRDETLLECSETAFASVHDLAMWRQKTLQDFDVFIVDIGNVMRE